MWIWIDENKISNSTILILYLLIESWEFGYVKIFLVVSPHWVAVIYKACSTIVAMYVYLYMSACWLSTQSTPTGPGYGVVSSLQC